MTPSAQATGWRPVRRSDLQDLLTRIGAGLRHGTRVFLVGPTSQLYEGWIAESNGLHLAASPPDRSALERALDRPTGSSPRIVLESPGDVIPLPDGHESRARPVTARDAPASGLRLLHFDPYSVSFRLIARGDEDDYRVVLAYLRHGWITVDGMRDLLEGILHRFTDQTIQQDPAEFRRKYKGLLQMWRAEGQGGLMPVASTTSAQSPPSPAPTQTPRARIRRPGTRP
ncbi:MAG TPA: hypothetical protein VF970_14420 [Gemmatimonadales bacterium]